MTTESTSPVSPVEGCDPDVILEAAAKTYGVTVEEMRGHNRSKRLRLARAKAVVDLYLTDLYSLLEIGALMERDHSTIIYTLKREGYKD